MAGKEKPKAPAKPATAKPAAAKATEGERIAKVLSRAGVASRREAERMIELGEVSVNGKVITSPAPAEAKTVPAPSRAHIGRAIGAVSVVVGAG